MQCKEKRKETKKNLLVVNFEIYGGKFTLVIEFQIHNDRPSVRRIQS